MARSRASLPLLGEAAVSLVAARFRILGDPARLRILNVLAAGELSVQDLVESTGLEQPNVSKHLGLLRREGIVARRGDGNRAFYRIVDPSVLELCEIVCGGLAARLAGALEALPRIRRSTARRTGS